MQDFSKTLSISIAAYNVSEYLPQTLDSIMQARNSSMVEAIVVNDGSTDSTLEVAKSYEQQYPGVVRVIDKANGNYGSTVNATIAEARGKYFRLLDGDDWFDTAGFDSYLEFLTRCDADMVVTRGYLYFESDGHMEEFERPSLPAGVIRLKDSAITAPVPMHIATYKTECLRAANLHLTEGCPYTDTQYNVQPLTQVNTVARCDDAVYAYRIGRSGQSISIDSWNRNIDKATKVTFDLLTFGATVFEGDYEEFRKKLIVDFVTECAGSFYMRMLSCPASRMMKQNLRDYDERLKAQFPQFWSEAVHSNVLVRLLSDADFALYRPLNICYRIHLKKRGLI